MVFIFQFTRIRGGMCIFLPHSATYFNIKIMEYPFIGREKEKAILSKALRSGEAEMVAIVGRRRIGKTFLVRHVYAENIDVEVAGIQNLSTKEQIQNFKLQLKNSIRDAYIPRKTTNWLDTFQLVIECLEKKNKTERMVVFIDELPWLAAPKSGFLNGLSFFWNSWASKKNIVVVICGSAASWMIQKIVQDKGGLHNRITKRIDLQPFNLYETELFFKSRHTNLDRYHIVQLYMALGGVPHYLKEVEAGKGAAQNIDQILFSKTALLKNEFDRLYPALFDQADNHISVVKALAKKRQGMTRQEILKTTNLADGGGTTRILDELEVSGFISIYYPFGKKKKDTFYRLTDEFSLFYIQFMENKGYQGEGSWQQLSQTQDYKSWSGYTFESICMKHINQIKRALGILGVYTEPSGFIAKDGDFGKGIQIDLVLDRRDHIINLFEIKFYNTTWTIDKEEAEKLKHKKDLFKLITKTPKQVFLTLISTFGLNTNIHSIGLIDSELTMNHLFEPD
jgi:uncharacterized protein